MRDVSRSSRYVVRVAMDAAASGVVSRRAKSLQRTAKSCGPGAATVASILSGLCWGGNGDNQRRSPGRARISRKAIARGKPACLGCTCQTRVRCFFFAHGAAGAVSARLSLRPFSGRGQRDCRTRAKASRGNAHSCFHVIASEAKQSSFVRRDQESWIASSLRSSQ